MEKTFRFGLVDQTIVSYAKHRRNYSNTRMVVIISWQLPFVDKMSLYFLTISNRFHCYNIQ